MQEQLPALPADDNPGMAASEQPIDIFTDGACKGNPGAGGWGALLQRRWRGFPRRAQRVGWRR